MELDDESYQKLRNYALRLLTLRPRSEFELTLRLKQYAMKKDISLKSVEKVMRDLGDKGLVNDKDFARWWVDQRRAFHPKGYQLIKMELVDKGIKKEIIEEVIGDKKENQEDDFVLALQIIQKRLGLYERFLSCEREKRITNFLLRRGFGFEVVKRVIDSLFKKS